MTCRHSADDPNCSSNRSIRESRQREKEEEASRKRDIEKERAELYARTPDVDKYEIEDVSRVGRNLVLKVRYPNCSKCAYEGSKVMVFLNVSEAEALKWRRIDPHFRDPKAARQKNEAPAPAARFPASPEGWSDALVFAQGKSSE